MEKNYTIEELEAMLAAKKKEEAEKKKAEAEAREKKLAEEKEARRKEIEDKYNEINNLINQYVKDYGSITLKRGSNCSPYPWRYLG